MVSPVLPPSYVKLGRWSVQCWRRITNKTFSNTPYLFCRSSLTNVEPASQISRVLAAFPGNLNRDCMIYISNDCLTIVWRLANLSRRLALHNVTIDRKDWKQMCSGIRELILSDVVISPNHQAEIHYLAMARYVECLSVHLHSAQAFPPILWPNVRLLRIEALHADKYQLWLDQVLWCREMFPAAWYKTATYICCLGPIKFLSSCISTGFSRNFRSNTMQSAPCASFAPILPTGTICACL